MVSNPCRIGTLTINQGKAYECSEKNQWKEIKAPPPIPKAGPPLWVDLAVFGSVILLCFAVVVSAQIALKSVLGKIFDQSKGE